MISSAYEANWPVSRTAGTPCCHSHTMNNGVVLLAQQYQQFNTILDAPMVHCSHCNVDISLYQSLVHFSFPSYLYTSPSSLTVDVPQAFATLNKIFLSSSFFFFFHFFSHLFFPFPLTKIFLLLDTSEGSPTSPDLFVSLVPPSLSFLLYSCHTELSHVLLPPFKYSISLHLFQSPLLS